MTNSPPKPWELEAGAPSPIDASGSNSLITDPQTTTKHLNNPHIKRTPSTQIDLSQSQSQTQTDTNTNTNINQNNNNTFDQSNQYLNNNNQLYNNSMYGGMGYGGMYGNSMYGNMGYGGMYGPGYGQMGMYGPQWGAMNFMQNSVMQVGMFSQLLQNSSQALHMTFNYLVQFAGNLGMLAKEYGGVFSGVYIIRFIKYIYNKIRKFIRWLFGFKGSSKDDFDKAFESAKKASKNPNNNNNTSNIKHNILSIGFFTFGILWLLQWIYRSIKNDLNDKKKKEEQLKNMQLQQQQQQQMNGMMPYNNMYAGGMYNPYGMGGMGYQPPMMQPQLMQQNINTNNNNENNNNNNNNNDTNNDNSKEEK